jgi:hypothetical protein
MSERLEEIKKELELDWSDISYVVNQVDVKWLINRVEELELEVSDWRAEVQKWQKFYKESEESHSETKELLRSILNQNKRYRKVIERALGESLWSDERKALYRTISILIKALESDEN